MYINPNIQKGSGISLREIPLLSIISQNRTEDLSEYIKSEVGEKELEDLFKRGLVTFVKPKRRDQDKYELVRISKEASNKIDLIRTPEITQGDEDMYNYLCEKYLSAEDDRVIGNKKKTRMYVAIFRKYNNLTLHEMYYLCMHFLDVYIYTKKLENIFFDPNKNRYGKLIDNMDSSTLYQFLDENREEIEVMWNKNIKEA